MLGVEPLHRLAVTPIEMEKISTRVGDLGYLTAAWLVGHVQPMTTPDNPRCIMSANVSPVLNLSKPSVVLMGVKEVAHCLNLSERTIWRLNGAGKLPKPVSIGGKSKRWRMNEIAAWIAAGCPDRAIWEAMGKNKMI